MIDVRVREHDGVNRARIERQIAIAVFGFLTPALIETAIQQISLPVDFQMMHGTGHSAGRAPKCNFHQFVRMMKQTGKVKEGACRRIGVVLVELCRMMNQTQTRKMIRALLFLPALLAAGDQPCDRKLTAAVSRPHAAVNVCISTVRLITATPVLLVEFEFDDIEEHGGLIVVYDLASLRAGKKKALFEETSSEGIIPFFFAGKKTLAALADFDGSGRIGFALACLGDTDSSLRMKAWDPAKASVRADRRELQCTGRPRHSGDARWPDSDWAVPWSFSDYPDLSTQRRPLYLGSRFARH